MNYQTNDTYGFEPRLHCEKNSGKSRTVPDQTIPIEKMLQHQKAGRPITINKQLVYTGDENLPDVRKMDLVDLKAAADNNRAIIDKAQKELRAQAIALKVAEQEAAWQKKYEAAQKVKPKPEGGIVDPVVTQ